MPVLRACATLLTNCKLPIIRNPRAGASFLITKFEGMKTQMRRSNSTRSVSSSNVTNKSGKLNEESLQIEAIRSDPDKLQSMTVKELRELTRIVGITARGTKKDLISALLSSLNDNDNENQQTESSKRKQIDSNIGENLESATVISESTSKQKRSKRKTTVVEADSVTTVTKHEWSVQTEETVVGIAEPWTILAHKKAQPHWIPYNPSKMRPTPLNRNDTKFLKLISWNVNGLRALLKSKGFSSIQFAQREDFDVLCLQETKIQEKDVEEIRESLIEGYRNSFWTCSVSKLGYSGTAIISRIKPLSVMYGLGVPDHDTEGRLVTVEFEDFYLLCGYVPNSGDGLRRLSYRIEQWDPSLSNYMKELEKSKPVILTGDLNCAHQEIDIFNPAGNRRSAGFTIEERESFERNFLSRGFVDTFRKQNPNVVAYTYWGYRHGGRKTNKGWRLDYFLVSESIADRAYDSYILSDVTGSDHSPIGLVLKL